MNENPSADPSRPAPGARLPKPPGPRRPRLKKRAISLLKIAVSVALLVIVLMQTGWAEVAGTLAGVQPLWLALALGVYVVGVFVRAARWKVLLRTPEALPGAQTLSLARLAGLYFVSFFFNSFLPTGIGGDVVRVAEVARAAGGPAAASSVIADRAIGLTAVSLLALVALPLAGAAANPALALVAGLAAVGPPAAFWLLARRAAGGLAGLERRLPFLRPITAHPKVRQTAEALAGYAPRDLALALAISLAFAATNALTYACIGTALGVTLPLAYYMLVSPIITLVLLLPISFNGLGTRDGAYQVLFVPAGVTPAGALAMSLAYHVLNLATGLAGGLLYALMGTSETLAQGREQGAGSREQRDE
jgi:hypothetical protein